jgi:tetratricopeptide (TPR) repeat protein/transcriptional regulator with XRE-family HTH domain
MSTFSELLTEYVERSGISDAELARTIGVRRQTIFRWKEGIVARPRHRDDVMRCARRLRLSEEETDALLLSAGFAPEFESSEPAPDPAAPVDIEQTGTLDARESDADPAMVPDAAVAPPRRSGRIWPGALLALFAVVAAGVLLVRLVDDPTPVASTPSPQPTRTFSPTATPIPIKAAPGETLLLVAPFQNFTNSSGYNVAGRIRDALNDELIKTDLEKARVLVWPETVSHEIRAGSVVAASDATMLIWGEYDSGRVRVHLSLLTEQAEKDFLLDSPDELSTTINVDVPKEIKGLTLLTLGRLYRDVGRFPDARTALKQALSLEPTEKDMVSTLLFYLGTVSERGEDQDLGAAITYYTRAAAMRPRLVTIRYNRGLTYLNRYYLQGDVEDLILSIDDLEWVVDQRSRYTQAMVNLAIARYERAEDGDVAEARKILDRAIELDSDNYLGYYNRALVNIRLGDREGWESDLGEVLALKPGHANSYNAYCWAYALEAEPDLALPSCDRALELDGGEGSRDARGIALAKLGRFDDAIADLNAYLLWLGQRSPSVYILNRGPQVEEWIGALEAGTDPFDDSTLESLR